MLFHIYPVTDPRSTVLALGQRDQGPVTRPIRNFLIDKFTNYFFKTSSFAQ